MIVGSVSVERVPIVSIDLGGRTWEAIVDTGFNGDLELPDALRNALDAVYIGQVSSSLGGGQTVDEDVYHVELPFDDEMVLAEATFVAGEQILIGTQMLQNHRLVVDFVEGSVTIERG